MHKLITINGFIVIDDINNKSVLTKEQWIELFNDKKIFHEKLKKVLWCFYNERDGVPTTKFVIDKYNFKVKNFNGLIKGLGLRIVKKYGESCLIKRSDRNEICYWPIIFNGWEDQLTDAFVWKVRSELEEAIEEVDLFKEFQVNEKETLGEEKEVSTYVYKEGKIVKTYATKFERSPKLRKEFIKKFKRDRGRLYCEACGFDFEKTYGILGADFIEVHHNKPVSTFTTEHDVNINKDLNCLCSNCHRMIHRNKGDLLSVNKLKQIIEKNKK